MPFDTSTLRPGDCLLYSPGHSVFSLLISIKTWNAISHCECYIGDNKSVASRDGLGVGEYDLRLNGLKYVLSPPIEKFSIIEALRWFETVKGQKYDWLGLLRFSWSSAYVPGELTDNKMFCSEFLSRFYDKGGWEIFNDVDCDSIAPCNFLLAPFVKRIKL